jgi:SHS2 domain-containing protein
MLATIVLNSQDVAPIISKSISIQSGELELTLVDWLSELLFLYETEGVVFSRFKVSLDGANLQATCFGQHVDESIHQLQHEVKAITYHGLKVVRDGDDWLAEVIVDI